MEKMKKVKKLEEELRNFNFIKLNEVTKEPIYNLVEGAKGALYTSYNYFEVSDLPLPIIYTCGMYQVIIDQGVDGRDYILQYAIR